MNTDQEVDEVFSALADPTRRKIVELLGSRAYRAGELAERLDISPPVTSRHLRILLQAGIVEDERPPEDARVRLFRLREQPITALQGWLDQLQTDWDEQLSGFKAYAESRAPRRRTKPQPSKGKRR
jgi:DNA-binding transcriptional ArsR family regulator